jgi:CMP-N-acetylneuraminic acid synthetase
MKADRASARYLGIVVARAGSKRLPGKNLMLLNGKPLIRYTLDAVRAARRLDASVVSTDSREIADYALSQGVDPQSLRPAELAGDTSPVTEALLDALGTFHLSHSPVDAVVLLQATSPLRRGEHIDAAIARFETTGADTVTSVRASKEHPYWHWRQEGDRLKPYYSRREMELDRQAIPPAFIENGAVYVIRRSVLEAGRIYGDTVAAFEMQADDSVDVDTELDFKWAELMLSTRNAPAGQR